MNKYFFSLALIVAVFADISFIPIEKNKKMLKAFENAGLKLPGGFSASMILDSIGKARHIIVTKKNTIYIKLSKLINNKGILYIKDSNGDGKVDDIKSFGNYIGTGITIKDGYLYASSNDEVFRYKLNENEEVINPDSPEK